MNAVTQRNAATSEETAAAAEELSGQSDRLEELVARFQLSGGPARPATPVLELAPAPRRRQRVAV